MIVTINGVDGSGKSTILEAIRESTKVELCHYHSRPGLVIPKNNAKKYNKYVDRPNEVPKRRRHMQLAKLALFLFEFQLLAIWHRITFQQKLVILERSLIDLYVHPARYGLESGLVERTQTLLMEWYVDLNICLTGDPRTIADRKQELDEPEISDLNNRYLEILCRSKEKLLVIDTTTESVAHAAERMNERLRKMSNGRVVR